MNTEVKNRTWVKDAAIIFLAVLLVLTFFSSTILNASLTEVATQQVKSGTITAKVRGTGKVVANGNNNVKAKATVTIAKVMVRTGEEVKTGDVLFVLGEGDSDELEAAKNALFDMETSYNAAVAALPLGSAYASERAAINARTRDVKIAEENLRIAQTTQSDVDGDSDKNEKIKLKQQLEKDIAAETEDYETLHNEYIKLHTALTERETYYNYIESIYNEQNVIAITESTLATAKLSAKSAADDFEIAQAEYEALKGTETDEEKLALASLEVARKKKEIADSNLASAEEACQAARESSSSNEIKKEDVETAKRLLQEAQEAYKIWCSTEATIKIGDKTITDERFELLSKLNEQIQNDTAKLNALNSWLTVWSEGTGYNLDIMEAEEKLESARENLYVAQANLAETMARDGQSASSAYISVQAAAEKIERQKEKIKELAGEGEEKTITAAVSGTVTEVNCSSGDTVIRDDILAVIEVADMGYTVSFSVTNDQARRLKVGDEATISNFYWGNEIRATLKSIATDRENPQNKKVLTFDLDGNVTAGSELTISVGQKSANYDLVIPNSAIRSDNNGQFVLVVSAKNSPLGNRYFAKRVKVDVLAEDDNNSAVTAELDSGDFVITTTSAPVNSGEQVRLADSAN